MVVATGASTLLSLWWPFPAESAASLNMAYLNNGYGTLFTWIYVLIWFIGQDAAKILTYWIMDKLKMEDKADVERRMALARISSAIDTDNRKARAAGVPTDITGSFRLPKDGGSFRAAVAGGTDADRKAAVKAGTALGGGGGSLSRISVGAGSAAGSFRGMWRAAALLDVHCCAWQHRTCLWAAGYAGGLPGATAVESASVGDEVRYLRDRVRRLESIVEEMRAMMMQQSGMGSVDTAGMPLSTPATAPHPPNTFDEAKKQ